MFFRIVKIKTGEKKSDFLGHEKSAPGTLLGALFSRMNLMEPEVCADDGLTVNDYQRVKSSTKRWICQSGF